MTEAGTEQKTLVRIPVTGMTCANCAKAVERSLSGIEGVVEVAVNPTTEMAEVVTDRPVPLGDMAARIQDSGYGVASVTADFAVLGMTCANCVRAVERAVAKIDGVLDVSVNLASERARVTFVPTITTLPVIKQAVVTAGYSVLREEEEAETSTLEQAQEKELRHQRRRLRVAVAFSVPVVLLTMPMDLGLMIDFPGRMLLVLLLTTPVMLYSAKDFFVGAYKALRNLSPNMDVLIAIGTGVAYLYSVVSYLWLHGPTHFEAAAVIVTLVIVGKYLEAGARRRASSAVRGLLAMQPQTARVVEAGQLVERPVSALQLGDVVVVGAGERVPIDGIVEEGTSSVDESMLTGESVPVLKEPDSTVYGGTINGPRLLRIRATGVGQDTMLSHIVRLVAQAQGSKAPVQRLADRVAAYFVPVVLVIAALTFVGWWVSGAGIDAAIVHAVAVVVVSCPCALGLATPAAITAGTGRGAQMGILIRGGEVLEQAGRVDTIILDKTGTLTEGKPQVTTVWPSDGAGEDEVLRYAAIAESVSRHPLAVAVVEAARGHGIQPQLPQEYEELAGQGVAARVDGHDVIVGSWQMLAGRGLATEEARSTAPEAASIFVALDGRLLGALVVSDVIRPTAARAVSQLKKQGLQVVVLSGDKQAVADSVGRQVGADRVLAEVLPQGKVAEVRRLQEQKRVVTMVGDGINDAPALAQADLGIAVGGGTAVAMEAADITLLSSDLMAVPRSIALARKTLRTIYQNLFWAFFYNVVLIPAAVFGLLQPVWAAAAMAMSSLFVVGNALRLQRWQPKD
ncbi:MAG: heavy metal translocating P-type ATPase [Anaerolineae bacterium]